LQLCAVALAGVIGGSTAMLMAGTASGAVGSAGGRALLAPVPGSMAAARAVHGVTQVATYNWSGWAQGAANGTYKSVVDTWKVPTVNTSLSGQQFSADWVGIGGLNDATLVQAGTEEDNINGTAQYTAWTEVLPAAEDPLSLVIHPGDQITTTVKLVTGKWKMTVKDVTTGLSAGRTATQTKSVSKEASVEAIHERPCIADGCTTVSDLANLTQTSNVTFDPGTYGTTAKPTKPLMTPALGATVDQIFMVNNAGTTIIASPSSPDSDNDGYTLADGATSPPPPSS
jgi:hypothetical protein